MNVDERIRRPVGRGALLRKLVENAASSPSTSDDNPATSSSNTDESRSNISSATSRESLLETSKDDSTDLSDAGYKSNTLIGSSKESLNITSTSGRSQGRGQRLLAMIQHANNSLSHDSVQLETAPKPFGRGRGKFLEMLKPIVDQTIVDETIVDQTIVSVDSGLQDLSLESKEEEPVIKMGTKGSYLF